MVPRRAKDLGQERRRMEQKKSRETKLREIAGTRIRWILTGHRQG